MNNATLEIHREITTHIKTERAPSAFGTSPKYDKETAYDHFNLGGQIWGRKSGSKVGESTVRVCEG